ncbi:hypothetical protein F4780DRAFT_553716 [Xylariomycetidae sp. FL0641]|nr:hypothetical protein F4780DRAFT_553716 [Xylariomycetidae sp. FL0641]
MMRGPSGPGTRGPRCLLSLDRQPSRLLPGRTLGVWTISYPHDALCPMGEGYVSALTRREPEVDETRCVSWPWHWPWLLSLPRAARNRRPAVGMPCGMSHVGDGQSLLVITETTCSREAGPQDREGLGRPSTCRRRSKFEPTADLAYLPCSSLSGEESAAQPLLWHCGPLRCRRVSWGCHWLHRPSSAELQGFVVTACHDGREWGRMLTTVSSSNVTQPSTEGLLASWTASQRVGRISLSLSLSLALLASVLEEPGHEHAGTAASAPWCPARRTGCI